jgi:hypothetical protein
MKKIFKFVIVLCLLTTIQATAQEKSNDLTQEEKTAAIIDFQLPTFSELSNEIASEYLEVRERLPNLANIGEYVRKSLRRGMLDEHNTFSAFHNLASEYSILPNISTQRFQMRNNLKNIMFTGFDVTQLHIGGAYRGGH